MQKTFQKLWNFGREIKNQYLERYYLWRIKSSQDTYQIRLRKEPLRVLFVLSHMRSGSSLLSHLLNTNPDIIGYGETHLHYANEAAVKELFFKVYWRLRDSKMAQKYVFDKILHNNKIGDFDILRSPQLRAIFMVREPQSAISSILKLKSHWNEEQAIEYYVTRLELLERQARLINDRTRCLFFTHEQLLHKTESVFTAMQKFLEVKHPFSEEYEILSTTGQKGVGDSSENIKSGRILRNYKSTAVVMTSSSIETAQQAFKKCQTILEQYCTLIDS